MSEMIDRVAKAVADELYRQYKANPQWEEAKDMMEGFVAEHVGGAAIAAMCEPTEAMLIEAREWSRVFVGSPIGNKAATGCWQAMHGGALK